MWMRRMLAPHEMMRRSSPCTSTGRKTLHKINESKRQFMVTWYSSLILQLTLYARRCLLFPLKLCTRWICNRSEWARVPWLLLLLFLFFFFSSLARSFTDSPSFRHIKFHFYCRTTHSHSNGSTMYTQLHMCLDDDRIGCGQPNWMFRLCGDNYAI